MCGVILQGATAAVPSAIAAALASEVASRHPPMAHSDMDDNEWEESGKHDDQQDDLFTSSIDTTSSVVSKSSRGSRHKHKHKKRSDSQLSNASLKSDKGQKETKKVSSKSGNCIHTVYIFKRMSGRLFKYQTCKYEHFHRDGGLAVRDLLRLLIGQ